MLKKGLIAGVAILVVSFVVNYLVQVFSPSLVAEYQNTQIFRPWTDPLMMAYYLYPFILGIVLSYLWNQLKHTGETVARALHFAILYFIVATIPGMFITLTSFQLSYAMILLWTLIGFVEAFVAGLIFVKIK